MLSTVTVYFDTGINGTDILSDPTILQNARSKVYPDTFYFREDYDKPIVRVLDTYENVAAVDFVKITTGARNVYYTAVPTPVAAGVCALSLVLDGLLSMGGAENLDYISGWQERGHIKKSDDVLFGNVAAESWTPSEPLVSKGITKLKPTVSQVTDDYDIIISNTDIGGIGLDQSSSDTQTVIKGVVQGDLSPKMYFPKIKVPKGQYKTSFSIWDYEENDTHGFSIPSTCAFDANSAVVHDGLEKLFSAGQLQLQNSYKIPKEYLQTTPTGGQSSTTGLLSNIEGVHDTKVVSNIPFEYTEGNYTVKNKKCFATYREISLAAIGSGDLISKRPEELYDGQATEPQVHIWADPTSTGKPYARFKYIKDSPLQYVDCVKGLQWANSQIVMEGASGSLWNSIDTAFSNQNLQRQQSQNNFAASLAVQQGELSARAANLGIWQRTAGMVNDMLSEGISGGFDVATGTKGTVGGLIGAGAKVAGSAMKATGAVVSQGLSMQQTHLDLQGIQNGVNAATARAEMQNNDLQNQINQNNIGLLKSNSVVAPTISFTPEQNLGLYGYNFFVAYETRKSLNDLKSEDMYYQRYGYNGLHRPLTRQCFKERQYYNYVQAFDVNLKSPVDEFGLRIRMKAIEQLNRGVRVWRVLPDPQYYETN